MLTYITLKIVGFPSLYDIILIWKTEPLMQVMTVINITDQRLTMFSRYDRQHVYWQVALCLPFGKVFLVFQFTLNFAYAEGKLHFLICFCIWNSNIMSFLLLMIQFVFILCKEQTSPLLTVIMKQLLKHRKSQMPLLALTSLAISLEALAALIGIASALKSQLVFNSSQASLYSF